VVEWEQEIKIGIRIKNIFFTFMRLIFLYSPIKRRLTVGNPLFSKRDCGPACHAFWQGAPGEAAACRYTLSEKTSH
jgi:hypothetical protein